MSDDVMMFQNPVFRDGVNVTVRDGRKWADRLKLGAQLCIGDDDHPNGRHDSQNRVIGLFYCSLDELPAAMLKAEHDPACRTKRGLAAELERIYGPKMRH